MSKYEWRLYGLDGAIKMRCESAEELGEAIGLEEIEVFRFEENETFITCGENIGCRIQRKRCKPTKQEAVKVLEQPSPCENCGLLKDGDTCGRTWNRCDGFRDWCGEKLMILRAITGCEVES